MSLINNTALENKLCLLEQLEYGLKAHFLKIQILFSFHWLF